jgi:hypothetical protein
LPVRGLPVRSVARSIEHVFDTSILEWPPSPAIAPPEEVIDCLVDDPSGVVEPVRWSEYVPDGLLADMLAQPAGTDSEHREFDALERVGGWERVIAWAQARQIREMTSFMHSAQARNSALGAHDSQAHDSAVAEVGLMLRASARTAACRVGDAWSLCTRLPATLAALEAGRITLAKARILDAETRLPGARPPLRPRPPHPTQPSHQHRPHQRNQPRPPMPTTPPDQQAPGWSVTHHPDGCTT